MIGSLIGGVAKAAVTGAVGVAVIGVLKDSRVGDTLREVAVTVTEVGVRGYKLVEDGAEKVYDTATGIYQDAARRADEAESDELADDLAADTAATAESVASEAEQFLRNNGDDGPSGTEGTEGTEGPADRS